jgi:hypothetical protein
VTALYDGCLRLQVIDCLPFASRERPWAASGFQYENVKYLIGALGAVFALMHIVEGGQKLMRGATAGQYTISIYAGHLIGICIGLAIALLCFRSPKSKRRIR